MPPCGNFARRNQLRRSAWNRKAPVGDPIEANALGSALCEDRINQCLIGSVKTNIGHLEAAAGIASLIKLALVLKHNTIPPSLHFTNPNPNIDFKKLKLLVVQKLENFPDPPGAKLAGINSFGFGGANAHVILEAVQVQSCKINPLMRKKIRKIYPLLISAHNQESLRAAAKNYRRPCCRMTKPTLWQFAECKSHAPFTFFSSSLYCM